MNTLALYDSVLKDDYQEVVRNQINFEAGPFYRRIEATAKDIEGGKRVVKAAPYGLNGGSGMFAESGATPAAGGNNYVQFISTLKNAAAVIKLSDKLIKSAKSDRVAFVNALDSEMDGAIKSGTFTVGSGLYLKADGIRAMCGVTTAATTVVLAATSTVQYLMEGMTIDIVVATTGVAITNGTGRRIESIDRTNKTVTLTGTDVVTTDATHAIVEQKSWGNNITGVGEIFDTSAATLYGLTRTTYPWLNPHVGTTAFDISVGNIINKISDQEDIFGAKIDLVVMHPYVFTAYHNYLEAAKSQVNTMKLEGGFETLAINAGNGSIPIIKDRFIPAQTMDLYDTSQFNMHQLEDWSWMDESGAILQKVSGYAGYEATLVKYPELICNHPGAQARIGNVTLS